MAIKFTGGYTYRFTYQDGSHEDYVPAGGNGQDAVWRDTNGNLDSGSNIFRNVVAIEEIARPPQAINERL